jgi:hypothetical protein
VVVRNPVALELRPLAEGTAVWVEVNSLGLDSHSLRMSAKVRQPPDAATLVPAQPMPAGIWKITLPELKGILELSLYKSSNYLNNKYFILETDPVSFAVPP